MKKTFITISIVIAAVISLASCKKDPLDITYGMSLNSTTMWKDPSDLTQSVPGIYLRLRNYFSDSECNVFYFGEIRVGDSMWGPSIEAKVADNFKIGVRHNLLNGSTTIGWSGLYSTIDQANAVLKYADKCRATQDVVDWARAQAYFARAYCYFWAARIWGYCPINLNPVESTTQEECYPKQHTPAEVLAQVGEDLKACEPIVDQLGTNKYFGTKAAFYMLKAEYGLWMYSTQNGGEEYLTLAEDALKALGISSSGLLTNYGDIFSRTNKVNNEVIFALNNTATSKAGYQVYFFHPENAIAKEYQNKNGGPVPIDATQWWSYPQSFVDYLKASEAAGDKRVKTNLGYGPYSSAADKHEITWCNKFLGDMSVTPVVRDCDHLYYRYAQAVLMDAELKYYKKDYAGANKSLNIIAKRAYGVDNKYTSLSPNDVLKNIVTEYTLEFPAEGVIWFALIRTGAIWDYEPNNERPGVTFRDMKEKNPNILLWPIANGSINKNPGNITQVPGWN
ncbi:MAG: RagB/SusD family nutrient uptake outer membrane protein [Bacteroidales bacterium]|nr:RagB/SusD family nutrient uptake outer membrane protein [Bacteroidales bacterium]